MTELIAKRSMVPRLVIQPRNGNIIRIVPRDGRPVRRLVSLAKVVRM